MCQNTEQLRIALFIQKLVNRKFSEFSSVIVSKICMFIAFYLSLEIKSEASSFNVSHIKSEMFLVKIIIN